MAKRSPISGYNHNVRYRGLIFHVQTEDSGVMSPHLFTHLFREGVIISTRKLVYDAGSDEGAIKSLMQAQHKAVMKDLKKGTFDDKIDLYLVGTPGLLPRGAIDVGDPEGAAAAAAAAERPSVPLSAAGSGEMVPPLPPPPPPPEDDAPTLTGDAAASIAEAIAAANAAKSGAATVEPPRTTSGSKPQIEVLDDGLADLDIQMPRGRQPRDTDIEMPFDPSVENIGASDAPSAMLDVGPTMPNLSPAIPATFTPPTSDGIPQVPALSRQASRTGPTGAPERRTLDRIPAVSSASLPPIPTRASTKPPTAATAGSRSAIATPVVVSRPIDDNRSRNESDAAEVYSPAPPTVEAPPGAMSERPGQYSQHRRSKQISVMPDPSRSGGVSIPAGLGRPRMPLPRTQTPSQPPQLPQPLPPLPEKTDPATIRTAIAPPSRTDSASMRAAAPTPARTSDSGRAIPAESAPTPPSGPSTPRAPTPVPMPPPIPMSRTATGTTRPVVSGEPARARTPTPARIQPGAVTRPQVGGNSSGVVMTRPAVIVGAPAKNSQSQTRIRKAREDEGRGFGQGLISEKSLDEVILAYLSEDGDEK